MGFMPSRSNILALAVCVMVAASATGAATAQVAAPLTPPLVPFALQNQPNVTVGDIHRYEMDRLRAQADANQALARSQSARTRATLQTLQAQRQPPLVVPEVNRPMTVEQARRAREAAEARGRQTGQIDAWLDRAPQ
jgi:hypothetical protein